MEACFEAAEISPARSEGWTAGVTLSGRVIVGLDQVLSIISKFNMCIVVLRCNASRISCFHLAGCTAVAQVLSVICEFGNPEYHNTFEKEAHVENYNTTERNLKSYSTVDQNPE